MAKCAKRRRFVLHQQLRRRQAMRAAMSMEKLEPRAMLATYYWIPTLPPPSSVRTRNRLEEFGFSSNCDIFSGTRLEWSAKGSEY